MVRAVSRPQLSRAMDPASIALAAIRVPDVSDLTVAVLKDVDVTVDHVSVPGVGDAVSEQQQHYYLHL